MKSTAIFISLRGLTPKWLIIKNINELLTDNFKRAVAVYVHQVHPTTLCNSIQDIASLIVYYFLPPPYFSTCALLLSFRAILFSQQFCGGYVFPPLLHFGQTSMAFYLQHIYFRCLLLSVVKERFSKTFWKLLSFCLLVQR